MLSIFNPVSYWKVEVDLRSACSNVILLTENGQDTFFMDCRPTVRSECSDTEGK